MDPGEHHDSDQERFARIRRAKQLLRYVPRRARLHRYPLVGRFASLARRTPYLWSFKRPHITPAFYAGSILAMLPLMGVQLPIAIVLAVMLRANFMVLGGLQFITNPVTAPAIYIGTYHLGRSALDFAGFGATPDVGEAIDEVLTSEDEQEPAAPAQPAADIPAEVPLSRGMKLLHMTMGAIVIGGLPLTVGGLMAGIVLGLAFDVFWRLGAREAQRHREKARARRVASDSTRREPPSH